VAARDGRAIACRTTGKGFDLARRVAMAADAARNVERRETADQDRGHRPARGAARAGRPAILPARESEAAAPHGAHRTARSRRCELPGRPLSLRGVAQTILRLEREARPGGPRIVEAARSDGDAGRNARLDAQP